LEQKETEELIAELETRVDRLRALYDQYFMGIEKMLPAVPLKDVERRFYVLRRTQIRNTALRFRFQNVLLKYNTYQTYWQRICRQIEEGTYKRDVRRANAKFAAPPHASGRRKAESEPPSSVDVEFDEDLDVQLEEEAPAARTPSFAAHELATARAEVARMREQVRAQRTAQQSAPPRPMESRPAPAGAGGSSYAQRGGGRREASDLPPALPVVGAQYDPRGWMESARPAPKPPASPPRPAAPTAGGLSDARVRQIYTQYVETKRRTGESTAAITFDSLARSLRDSSQKLRERHAGKSVDFEVAVKDGKAILRPVVK